MGGNGLAVTVTNLTPTFWSVCVLIVLTAGALLKVWPLLDRQKREGDASLRADLMKMLNDERGAHSREMASLRQEMIDERRRCDEDLAGLRAQVEGLQRMIVQFSNSAGRAIELGKVPEAAKSIDRVAEHLARREGEAKE